MATTLKNGLTYYTCPACEELVTHFNVHNNTVTCDGCDYSYTDDAADFLLKNFEDSLIHYTSYAGNIECKYCEENTPAIIKKLPCSDYFIICIYCKNRNEYSTEEVVVTDIHTREAVDGTSTS